MKACAHPERYVAVRQQNIIYLICMYRYLHMAELDVMTFFDETERLIFWVLCHLELEVERTIKYVKWKIH